MKALDEAKPPRWAATSISFIIFSGNLAAFGCIYRNEPPKNGGGVSRVFMFHYPMVGGLRVAVGCQNVVICRRLPLGQSPVAIRRKAPRLP